MSVDRETLLYHEALAATFLTLASGFLYDTGMKGTAIACAIVVICLCLAILITWLGPNPDINERG